MDTFYWWLICNDRGFRYVNGSRSRLYDLTYRHSCKMTYHAVNQINGDYIPRRDDTYNSAKLHSSILNRLAPKFSTPLKIQRDDLYTGHHNVHHYHKISTISSCPRMILNNWRGKTPQYNVEQKYWNSTHFGMENSGIFTIYTCKRFCVFTQTFTAISGCYYILHV